MGAMSFGPRCAKRMGLLAAKNIAANARNTCARGRYFTENQMELFDADAGQLPACMEIK
jgi:hypothetical protein